jgi:hypothetical protein
MSGFSDLFTSPREREGQQLWGQSQNDYSGLMNDINATQSIYSDPGRMAQIGGAVNQQFGAARSNVATSNARARSAAARRMNANSATPEMTFGNVDANFADAYGRVEEAAQSETGNVLRGQDNFAFNKLGAKGDALNAKQAAIKNYLSSLSDTSMGGDILRGASAIGGIPTGAGGATVATGLGKKLGLWE